MRKLKGRVGVTAVTLCPVTTIEPKYNFRSCVVVAPHMLACEHNNGHCKPEGRTETNNDV